MTGWEGVDEIRFRARRTTAFAGRMGPDHVAAEPAVVLWLLVKAILLEWTVASRI
jgi:hypothetical protein